MNTAIIVIDTRVQLNVFMGKIIFPITMPRRSGLSIRGFPTIQDKVVRKEKYLSHRYFVGHLALIRIIFKFHFLSSVLKPT